MDNILNNAVLNFETTIALYQNKFHNDIVIFPKTDEQLKEEENIIYILRYIFEEISIYCSIIENKSIEDTFFEKFKIHSYLSTLNSIDFPVSKKIYDLLKQIKNITQTLKN